MASECAFCGCAMSGAAMAYCEDCSGTHDICRFCARLVADGCEGVHLVA
jgi:hypothetical protein